MADVKRAAVIGTGTMGPGMGAVLARAGIETALYDVSAEALERAQGGLRAGGRGARPARGARGEGGGRPLRDASWAPRWRAPSSWSRRCRRSSS